MKYTAPLMVMPLVFLMVLSALEKKSRFGFTPDSVYYKSGGFALLSGVILFVLFYLLERKQKKARDKQD